MSGSSATGRLAMCLAMAAAVASGPASAVAQEPAPAKSDLSAHTALEALKTLCLNGDTAPLAVLARADAAGWLKAKPAGFETWDASRNRAQQSGPTTLILDTWGIDTREAHEDSCSIGARASTSGWGQAAREWLGFSPGSVLGPASTFHAVRTDAGWRAAAAADRAPSARTNAEERHYNFVAADGAWSGAERAPAILMVNHLRTTRSPGG
jgi:hypothetical protein